MHLLRLFLTLCLLAWPLFAIAASSPLHQAPALTARLITAEEGVAPDAGTVSAGLEVEMLAGWKTYWRTPGEVGLAPELDWSASRNLAGAELLFPAPTRFTAFEIENFGYGGTVTFPIAITLATPGKPATLSAQVRLLVCKDICIPEDFNLTLPLPASAGIDGPAAARLAEALAKVPESGTSTGVRVESAHLDQAQLTVALHRAQGFTAPDIFPELGDATFGKPEQRLSADRTRLWASFPRLYAPPKTPALSLTVTDAGFAATLDTRLSDAPPPAPAAGTAAGGLLWTALIAVLGGLILNVMPCVLPVLSIKLASAVQKADKGHARIRSGFLLSALGVLSFFWLLGAATWLLQSMGHAVGWGLQFQSPVFLTIMIAILVLFAANLTGLFELSLPSALQTGLARTGSTGHLGDFATGAFAAILATPCSAPFLGTAVAYALSGGGLDIAVIFTALGFGLALPYMAVAARPGVVAALPKPGRWMLSLKLLMGALLALTAVWLFLVLVVVAGGLMAAAIAALMCAVLIVLFLRHLPMRAPLVAALAAAAILLPALQPTRPLAAATTTSNWSDFDLAAIGDHVNQGRVVFVDVTADWCLTCKANKTLVLDRNPVADTLAGDAVVAMQADWTRPDPAISAYLQSFNRYGIPFNAVYGPAAPNGIALPELLSTEAVLSTIAAATGE